MILSELRKKIESGALSAYGDIYADINAQQRRILGALDAFAARYGEEKDVMLLSVPGRSEISGNHTDHNHGKVLAGAIDRDVIAICSRRDDGKVRLYSEGYQEEMIDVTDVSDPSLFEDFTSGALIAGMVNGFNMNGHISGCFDAYLTSEVLRGSGISSSAAYEVMIGNILNHLYNGGKVDNTEIAKLAQYAENTYFGKPCGLMDQTACAVGGFVYIDFEEPKDPCIEPIAFSLSESGYSLCIVNTGGNHADLNADYASVPSEMKSVAKILGREVLRGLTEDDIIKNIVPIRRNLGDRAVLRALHFVRENDRVSAIRDALVSGDVSAFFRGVRESGRSSFEYLQNVYTTVNVGEQGLSLALALADGFLGDEGAFRVHGGGFAGTVQVFVPSSRVGEFTALMDGVFGDGATMILNIRPRGACRLF